MTTKQAEHVTDLRDARAFREMGLPLNSPVIDCGELPAPAAKAMSDGFAAGIKFRARIYAYVANQNASTHAAMVRAFRRFMKKTEPPADDPLAAGILESEFGSIRAEWSAAFERADGSAVDVSAMWPWKETEASERRKRCEERRGL